MKFRLNILRSLIAEAFTKAYELLGVSPNASGDEIKAAHRKLLLKLHPDRNRDRDTTADMAQINAAFTILSDPEKRRKYDYEGDKTFIEKSFSYKPPVKPPITEYNDRYKQKVFVNSKTMMFWRIRWSTGTVNDRRAKRNYVGHVIVDEGHINYLDRQQRKGYDIKEFFTISKERQDEMVKRKCDEKQAEGYVLDSQFDPNKRDNKRMYVNIQKTPNKFWSIAWRDYGDTVTVSWGDIGTNNHKSKIYNFSTVGKKKSFIAQKCHEKLVKGYIRDDEFDPKSAKYKFGPESAEYQQQKREYQQQPHSRQNSSSDSKQYKIYPGGKGQPPVTRYKGTVYSAKSTTRFKPGDKANVSVGSKGRLNVTDPQTDHTQTWDVKENVRTMLLNLVLETLVKR